MLLVFVVFGHDDALSNFKTVDGYIKVLYWY